MFVPGRIEVDQVANGYLPAMHLLLEYTVDPVSSNQHAHFHLSGQVGQRMVEEKFSMHRDEAYNFLAEIDHRLRRYGVPLPKASVFTHHEDYDQMFEDLREKLHTQPGDPIDLDRLVGGE